jgi:uncharacterized membrane protein
MSAVPPPAAAGGRTRRWVLIASLALNVFLIAFLAVGTVRHHHHEDRPMAFREMMMFMRDDGADQRFLRHFSDADAAVMRRLRATYGADMQVSRADARAARDAVRVALLSGGDPDAIRQAMDGLRAARLESYETFEPFLIDLGQGLSQEALERIAGERGHRRP